MQCKLNFRYKPKSFQTEQLKVNYSLSFLKGTALDYFEPYLTDDPANEPTWLNDYELFVEELLINFGLYNMMANAEVELEQLIMKDNHKATKFFINFYQLTLLLQYNDKAHTLLSQRGSRMKWYTSKKLACSTDSRTSFRKLTNIIGNEKANSCERSHSLPSKIKRTTSQPSPAKPLSKSGWPIQLAPKPKPKLQLQLRREGEAQGQYFTAKED